MPGTWPIAPGRKQGRQYVLRQDEEPAAGGAPPTDDKPAFATVIAESAAEIDTLSVGEAVMRMDLADQQLLMFRNSATTELNVVYRRTDGHIGWIDPAGSKPAV